MKDIKKVIKRIIIIIICIPVAVLLVLFMINLFVVISTAGNIETVEQAASEYDHDCAIVLGCSVRPDKTPSDMLKARLDAAVSLYEKTGCKIVVSGDHEDQYYNEVKIMKEYLVGKGIPSEKIYMDHSGFSTYDSMYRLKYIFGVEKAVIITQRFHLYRALFIAEMLGMEATGVEADDVTPGNSYQNYMREIMARPKALYDSIRKVRPKVLGEKVDMSLSGDLTDEL